jgi:hypothetical protein
MRAEAELDGRGRRLRALAAVLVKAAEPELHLVQSCWTAGRASGSSSPAWLTRRGRAAHRVRHPGLPRELLPDRHRHSIVGGSA